MPTAKTVSRRTMSRKARFRASLGLARMTQEEWAARHGVKGGHLSQVINGKRVSARLVAQIDVFIRQQLGQDAA